MTAEEEIASGLRNAVERGVPMEEAAKSFINAGYPESAVRSAVRSAEGNAPIIIHKSEEVEETKPEEKVEEKIEKEEMEAPKAMPLPNAAQSTQDKKEKPLENKKEVGKSKIIILVSVLILLILVLGVSLYLF